MGKFPTSLAQKHNARELPSLEEIKVTIDEPSEKAIQALKISADKSKIKCQCCSTWLPIRKDLQAGLAGRDSTGGDSKIAKLKANIKRSEEYGRLIGIKIDCKSRKEKLAYLLGEHKKIESFLRKIPMYSTSSTGYKWYCSSCFDNATCPVIRKNI